MDNSEMHSSCESFDELHPTMLFDAIAEQRQQHDAATRHDAGMCESRESDGERSDEEASPNGSPSYGRRMHHDEDEWVKVDDVTNYYHSDEGVEGHLVEHQHYDYRRSGRGGHGMANASDVPRVICNFCRLIAVHRALTAATYLSSTNAPAGTQTPNSPSSTYPEPGSSSDSSLESSGELPPLNDSTTVLRCVTPEPCWAATPAHHCTPTPLRQTTEPPLFSDFVRYLDRAMESESSDDEN